MTQRELHRMTAKARALRHKDVNFIPLRHINFIWFSYLGLLPDVSLSISQTHFLYHVELLIHKSGAILAPTNTHITHTKTLMQT